MQLERKYETTNYFIEEISDRYKVPWRAINGILEIRGDTYQDFGMNSLVKKFKENHEENICNHFYIGEWEYMPFM